MRGWRHCYRCGTVISLDAELAARPGTRFVSLILETVTDHFGEGSYSIEESEVSALEMLSACLQMCRPDGSWSPVNL